MLEPAELIKLLVVVVVVVVEAVLVAVVAVVDDDVVDIVVGLMLDFVTTVVDGAVAVVDFGMDFVVESVARNLNFDNKTKYENSRNKQIAYSGSKALTI